MKIITKYLMREVYTNMLATIMVLLLIFASNVLVRLLHDAAGGALSSKVIITILFLQLPILSAILFPASLFLGVLFAYGRLYAESEMVIFTACGISPGRLLRITLIFSSWVVILVAVLSFVVNPKIYKYSDHIKSGATATILEGVKAKHFNEIAQGKWIFYVEDISSDKKHFHHVFAAEQPTKKNYTNNDLLGALTATSAYQKIDKKSGDLYLVLVDGYRYLGVPGHKDYEVIKYHEYGIQIKQQASNWYRDESSKSTLNLWQTRGENLVAAELQWRLALPLSVLLLVLVGVPLSRINPKHGRYAKAVPAILLYIIYANFLFLARAWLRRGILTPIVGMWWVHGFMFIVALWLLGKQLGWRKSLVGVNRS
jgi:lipopolysaccharide export system permease protein